MEFITLDNIRGLPNEDSLFYLFHGHEMVEKTKAMKRELQEELYEYPDAPSKDLLILIKLQNSLDEAIDQAKIWKEEIGIIKESMRYNHEIVMRNLGKPKYGKTNTKSMYETGEDNDDYTMNCARCFHFCYWVPNQNTVYPNKPCKGCNALICARCSNKSFAKDKGYCWFCQYEFNNGVKEKPKTVRVKGKKNNI